MVGKNEVDLERRLIAEFFANIGVAWFAAGVIGLFVSGSKSFVELLRSLGWGFSMSYLFLLFGKIVIRKG